MQSSGVKKLMSIQTTFIVLRKGIFREDLQMTSYIQIILLKNEELLGGNGLFMTTGYMTEQGMITRHQQQECLD